MYAIMCLTATIGHPSHASIEPRANPPKVIFDRTASPGFLHFAPSRSSARFTRRTLLSSGSSTCTLNTSLQAIQLRWVHAAANSKPSWPFVLQISSVLFSTHSLIHCDAQLERVKRVLQRLKQREPVPRVIDVDTLYAGQQHMG